MTINDSTSAGTTSFQFFRRGRKEYEMIAIKLFFFLIFLSTMRRKSFWTKHIERTYVNS